MKKYKISLYGNLILDENYIFKNFELGTSNKFIDKKISIGGIGNLYRYLQNDFDIQVHSCVGNDTSGKFIKSKMNFETIEYTNYKSTSSAIIISDISKMQTTSFVNWSACKGMPYFKPDKDSFWNHFAYIDNLIYLTPLELTYFNGIVSADMCYSHTRFEDIKNMLPLIDYLIISDEEAKGMFLTLNEAINEIKSLIRKAIIIHYPTGSIYSDKNETYSFSYDKIDNNINVLGAGDYFASMFIMNTINGYDIHDTIKISHEKTKIFLTNNEN